LISRGKKRRIEGYLDDDISKGSRAVSPNGLHIADLNRKPWEFIE
jgi:hypothetical protein